jgi:hypothetical protein
MASISISANQYQNNVVIIMAKQLINNNGAIIVSIVMSHGININRNGMAWRNINGVMKSNVSA